MEESVEGIDIIDDEDDEELGTVPDFFDLVPASSMPLSDRSSRRILRVGTVA